MVLVCRDPLVLSQLLALLLLVVFPRVPSAEPRNAHKDFGFLKLRHTQGRHHYSKTRTLAHRQNRYSSRRSDPTLGLGQAFEGSGMIEMFTPFDSEPELPPLSPPQQQIPIPVVNAISKPPPDEGEHAIPQSPGEATARDDTDAHDQTIRGDIGSYPSLCPSSPCSTDLEVSRQIRILQIKHQILKETGIKSLPNMTGFVLPKIPHLHKLIDNINEQNRVIEYSQKNRNFMRDDPTIRSEKMFLTPSNNPTRVNIPDGHRLLFFNLSQEHASGITMATLHFWLKPTKNTSPKHTAAKITILNVEPSKYPHDYNRLRTIIDDITVPYSPHGIWANVDVFRLVTQWIPNFEDNLGFVVKVSTVDGVMLDIDTVEDDPYHAPLLELDVRKEHNDRSKRFANKRICSDQKIERDCCRYPLIVNFLKYKFDFIVAPKKYMANYCTGECPFLYAHKIPHISVVQQLFPANSTKSNHGPCCGARDLSPLKMLYYDGRTIKLDVINDMVVNQCSCT